MSAIVQNLTEARKLIERGWTQQALALDKHGKTLYNPKNPKAVCWCALGAIEATDANPSVLYSVIKNSSIAKWNDAPERTQADVLAAFDKAIELARAEAGQ